MLVRCASALLTDVEAPYVAELARQMETRERGADFQARLDHVRRVVAGSAGAPTFLNGETVLAKLTPAGKRVRVLPFSRTELQST